MEQVGVVGCGAMGRGLVKNLLKKGYQVFAYDLNPKALKEVQELGASPMPSVTALAGQVSVLITSLPSSSVLAEIILDQKGALQELQPNSYILDFGTTDVEITRQLNKQATEKGVHFFDCPVSGGPKGAAEGSLTIMVGGDKNYLESILPILQAVGKNIKYIGEAGSGQVVKLCHNMVVAGITTLLSEAFLTGVKAGVSVESLAEIMQMGSAHNRVLSIFGPNILNNTHENILFFLSHMAKDVDLYMQLAKQGGVPTLVSSNIHHLYQIALIKGKGGLDTSAISQVLEELTNQKIKEDSHGG